MLHANEMLLLFVHTHTADICNIDSSLVELLKMVGYNNLNTWYSLHYNNVFFGQPNRCPWAWNGHHPLGRNVLLWPNVVKENAEKGKVYLIMMHMGQIFIQDKIVNIQ